MEEELALEEKELFDQARMWSSVTTAFLLVRDNPEYNEQPLNDPRINPALRFRVHISIGEGGVGEYASSPHLSPLPRRPHPSWDTASDLATSTARQHE